MNVILVSTFVFQFLIIISDGQTIKEQRSSLTACYQYRDKVVNRLERQIVGGEDAEWNEFPHMAALGYPSDESVDFEWNCGGSLISSSFVLTAAHCIHTRIGQPTVVRLGRINLNANNQNDDDDDSDYEIADIIVHENYNSTLRLNDIALLKLNRSVEQLLPACLYHENDNPTRILIVSGWGLNESAGGVKPNTLQKATLQATSNDLCADSYKGKLITSTHICAKALDGQRTDTCWGDSGGPLQFQPWRLSSIYSIVGITSFGRTGCGGNHPGVYTRVNSYLDWIEKYVWP